MEIRTVQLYGITDILREMTQASRISAQQLASPSATTPAPAAKAAPAAERLDIYA